MKIGLSSYSLVDNIYKVTMSICDVIDWAAENGAEHIELVPFGFTFEDDDELIKKVKEKAEEKNIEISNYSVLADLLKHDKNEYQNEIKKIMKHIDIAYKLGIKYMRHDISSFRRPLETNTTSDFEKEFEQMVEASSILIDYAARYGITTLVENHGFFVNGSDRVIRIIEAVNKDNFKMLLDVGNFACVDERCEIAVKKCLPYTKIIHLKDFYIRKPSQLPLHGKLFDCNSGNWFFSLSNNYLLRGSIVGQGDLDMHDIAKSIKDSSFDGFIAIEFEGLEKPETGSSEGLSAAEFLLK